jgi:hypothetical protein
MPNPAWTEKRIEIDFSGAIVDPATGVQRVSKPDALAAPLKCVDFVAYYSDELWLIELKDPEDAAPPLLAGSIAGNLAKVRSDELRKTHLLPKLFGVYAYLVESGAEPRGRVRYACLIGLTALTNADRMFVTNAIQRTVDRIGPKVRHSRHWPIVEVHNLASWNVAHPTMMAVRHP